MFVLSHFLFVHYSYLTTEQGYQDFHYQWLLLAFDSRLFCRPTSHCRSRTSWVLQCPTRPSLIASV